MKSQSGGRDATKFKDGIQAILWVSANGLQKNHVEGIHTIVDETFREIGEENEESDYDVPEFYYGTGFGRYNIVIEFHYYSIKIASYFTCKLQNKLRAYAQRESFGPICTSLTICHEFDLEGIDSCKLNQQPIHMYVFLKIKQDRNKIVSKILEHVTQLNKQNINQKPWCRVMWNTSAYSIVLSLHGEVYYNLVDEFTKFLEFCYTLIEGNPENSIQSCTFTTLAWGKEDQPYDSQVKEKGLSKDIKGLVDVKISGNVNPFCKLRSFFKDSKQGNIWDRQGGFDKCININRSTLSKIRELTFECRRINNNEIDYTATVLMKKGTWRENN